LFDVIPSDAVRAYNHNRLGILLFRFSLLWRVWFCTPFSFVSFSYLYIGDLVTFALKKILCMRLVPCDESCFT
jgi:hypothetical protein